MEGHRPYQEELAAYMLGALPEDEAREFERHLDGCAVCQAEQRWLTGAVEVLPSSVEQLEPPPELRERLMETVRAEATSAGRPERRAAPRRRRRLAFVLRPATAFGAAALIGIGVGAGYLIGDQGGGGAHTVAVKPTQAQSHAGGRIVRDSDAAVIQVFGLRQQRDRIYEVWLRPSGSKNVKPSSLFAVHKDGTGVTGIPGGLDGVAEVMVSSEPSGGSIQPTTTPVLRATL